MYAAGHKALAVSEYALIAAKDQLQDRIVWSNCLAEQLQSLHDYDVTGEKLIK